jgi:hypothetical protein
MGSHLELYTSGSVSATDGFPHSAATGHHAVRRQNFQANVAPTLLPSTATVSALWYRMLVYSMPNQRHDDNPIDSEVCVVSPGPNKLVAHRGREIEGNEAGW